MEITVDKRNGFLRVHEEFARIDRTYVEMTGVFRVSRDLTAEYMWISAVFSTPRQRRILTQRVTRYVNAWIRENEAKVLDLVIAETKRGRDAAKSRDAELEAKVAQLQDTLAESRIRTDALSADLADLRKRYRKLKKS